MLTICEILSLFGLGFDVKIQFLDPHSYSQTVLVFKKPKKNSPKTKLHPDKPFFLFFEATLLFDHAYSILWNY